MRGQRALAGVLLALTVACGGGSSPAAPPAVVSPPAPTPTPPPEPGFVLVQGQRIDWPATDPAGMAGIRFSVPAPGDVLIELVEAAVVGQTISTELTLSLHSEASGGGPQCVQFETRCTGIVEDEAIVPSGGSLRRLATSTTVATGGPYFAMVRRSVPAGVQGTLKAWFRPKAS